MKADEGRKTVVSVYRKERIQGEVGTRELDIGCSAKQNFEEKQKTTEGFKIVTPSEPQALLGCGSFKSVHSGLAC